jgi:hypothetical protein
MLPSWIGRIKSVARQTAMMMPMMMAGTAGLEDAWSYAEWHRDPGTGETIGCYVVRHVYAKRMCANDASRASGLHQTTCANHTSRACTCGAGRVRARA